jgi:hypothetical protein
MHKLFNKKNKYRRSNMEKNEKNQSNLNQVIQENECPKKDKDGNCLVPGVYSDSDPIGGG